MTSETGERIRRLRKQKGLTLDQLAELAHSSKSYIWELENKNPPRPSAEKLAGIAAALGTTIDALIGTDPAEGDLSPEDRVFFRKYRKLGNEEKKRFQKMIDLWGEE